MALKFGALEAILRHMTKEHQKKDDGVKKCQTKVFIYHIILDVSAAVGRRFVNKSVQEFIFNCSYYMDNVKIATLYISKNIRIGFF